MADPLVLLHAFPLSSAMWSAQKADLTARGHRVLTPDQRGFGHSPHNSLPPDLAPDLDVAADDLSALLDRERIPRAVIGGNSMGGYVAMAFLRRYPDRVAGLALIDTKASADTEAARANRERIAATVEAERSNRVLIDDVLPGLLGKSTFENRPAVVGRVKEMINAARPAAVAWAQRAMGARPDSFSTLRAGPLPAVVIVGAEDGITPPEESAALVDALPGATLVTVPDAGHLTPLEAPEAVTTALAEFLERPA